MPFNFHIYNSQLTLIAGAVYAEDAAMIVASLGNGAYIESTKPNIASSVVWEEGEDEISAGESWDRAAEIIRSRL